MCPTSAFESSFPFLPNWFWQLWTQLASCMNQEMLNLSKLFILFRLEDIRIFLLPCRLHVIKFVSDLLHVDGFLRVLRFPPLIKLIMKYCWNCVKHHKPKTICARISKALIIFLPLHLTENYDKNYIFSIANIPLSINVHAFLTYKINASQP